MFTKFQPLRRTGPFAGCVHLEQPGSKCKGSKPRGFSFRHADFPVSLWLPYLSMIWRCTFPIPHLSQDLTKLSSRISKTSSSQIPQLIIVVLCERLLSSTCEGTVFHDNPCSLSETGREHIQDAGPQWVWSSYDQLRSSKQGRCSIVALAIAGCR